LLRSARRDHCAADQAANAISTFKVGDEQPEPGNFPHPLKAATSLRSKTERRRNVLITSRQQPLCYKVRTRKFLLGRTSQELILG